jgi:methionyl-tRNA formyltransferase
MRILFAGSPAIAVPSLRVLVEQSYIDTAPFTVVGVLTNPDTPKGRVKNPEPTEVAKAAVELNKQLVQAHKTPLVILKPEHLDAEIRSIVAALEPDLLVTIAYGKIFGPKFLALFPEGGINIHPSLLPRYRGATPIQSAILNRDTETGITIQRLALKMDSGDILLQKRRVLVGTETTASLTEWAAETGAQMLLEVLDRIIKKDLQPIPQDESQASYCKKITREDAKIDWHCSALQLDAKIRAYTPWPLCYTHHNNKILYVLEAVPYSSDSPVRTATPGTVLGVDKQAGILIQTGEGILAVHRLQYATKKTMEWGPFLNGVRDFIGSTLGDS